MCAMFVARMYAKQLVLSNLGVLKNGLTMIHVQCAKHGQSKAVKVAVEGTSLDAVETAGEKCHVECDGCTCYHTR